MFRRFAAAKGAVNAAKRYARKNPDKTTGYIDKASTFVDKQTGGKYSDKVSNYSRKAKEATTGQSGPELDQQPPNDAGPDQPGGRGPTPPPPPRPKGE